MCPRDPDSPESHSFTDQINAHVEVLANLLHRHSPCLSDLCHIGVELHIPMGVRQRLIQLHGDQARHWLNLVDRNKPRPDNKQPIIVFDD